VPTMMCFMVVALGEDTGANFGESNRAEHVLDSSVMNEAFADVWNITRRHRKFSSPPYEKRWSPDEVTTHAPRSKLKHHRLKPGGVGRWLRLKLPSRN